MRLIDADSLWERTCELEEQARLRLNTIEYRGDLFNTEWKVWSAILKERTAFKRMLDSLPTVNQWTPFKTRPLTEEEKEDHPEWDCILDCRLPDDGQEILVSLNVRGHENVQYDEFFTYDGIYLDSGYELGAEAIAWMPLPKPYEVKENEKTVEEKET